MFCFSKNFCKGEWNFAVLMLIQRCQWQDFQTTFKIWCIKNHNNMAQKLKEMTDIRPKKNKSNSENSK